MVFFFAIFFNGCIYFNETGISGHLYDNCEEYYDSCGNYHKECPKNLADYTEIKQGISDIGHEIGEGVSDIGHEIKKTIFSDEKENCEPAPVTK
jgi:hypothetical protein